MLEYFENDAMDMSFLAAGALAFIYNRPGHQCTIQDILKHAPSRNSNEQNFEDTQEALQELTESPRVSRRLFGLSQASTVVA